jgi:hypothetical protein
MTGALVDAVALAFVYFVPAIAHLISFPVYMIEPMRLMVILSMAHSTKKNSYLLALTLPLFSFIVSSHPEFVKMLVISAELALNVFLFYLVLGRMKNVFAAMISAIVISKLFSYVMYMVFFSLAFARAEAETSFLLAQLATTLMFSSYVFFFRKRINPS